MKVVNLPADQTKEKKPKKAELFHRLVLHMNGIEAGLRVPFLRQFIMVEISDGVAMPCEVTSDSLGTVKFTTKDEIRRAIINYVWEHAPNNHWHWTVDDAKKCTEMFMDMSRPEPMPDAVKFASETGYCFTKHPFDPDNLREPHTFNEIMANSTNSDAMMAFWGSLFVEGANQQQYLWLKGPGQDAKGCLTRLFKKILGSACRSANPPTRGQNKGFWLNHIIKAKLLVFNDIEDRTFVTTGLGKSLTGGDVQQCEIKGGMSYDAFFNGKLVFTSNWTPNISSEHSDQRRIIYCEMNGNPDKKVDPAFEAKLWLEAPNIIFNCIEKYHKLCPKNEPIPTDNTEALEIATENEDDFELFMKRFNIVKIKEGVPDHKQPHCEQTEFTSELRFFFHGRPAIEREACKKWIARTYPGRVIFKTIRSGSVTKRVVLGLTKKAPQINN